MAYQCVVQEIESPRLREADYFSEDLDRHYLLEQSVGLELYDNPVDIEKDLRSPAIKNPVTVKMVSAEPEEPLEKSREQKRFDYIPEMEYADDMLEMFDVTPAIYSMAGEAEVLYLSDFMRTRVQRGAAAEAELAEAA